MNDYSSFLAKKAISHQATGIAEPPELSPLLKPFQRDVTRWALQKGRAAAFLDCGLGKQRYGTALYANNGRSALRDAYEEALDLACYLRQALEEAGQ